MTGTGWRTDMENAPRDGTAVLGCMLGRRAIVVYRFNGIGADGNPVGWWTTGWDEISDEELTHWMPIEPLPAAPEDRR